MQSEQWKFSNGQRSTKCSMITAKFPFLTWSQKPETPSLPHNPVDEGPFILSHEAATLQGGENIAQGPGLEEQRN